MMYLISQLWIWLLIAFAIGLFVGWVCYRQPPVSWWSSWAPWGALAFLFGLVIAVLRLIPDWWGYLLDTALLLFAAYIIGCLLGSLLCDLFCGAGQTATSGSKPVVATAATGGAALAAKQEVGSGSAAHAQPAVQAQQPVAAIQPATEPATQVQPEAQAPAKSEAATPESAAEQLPGQRPKGYSAPVGGKADDLKRIRGIGKQNEGRLHALGIWHFSQVSEWSNAEIEWVSGYLAFPGRIQREQWVEQAKILATGGETDFSKRVDRGEVATSQDSGSKGQDNVADLSSLDKPVSKPGS